MGQQINSERRKGDTRQETNKRGQVAGHCGRNARAHRAHRAGTAAMSLAAVAAAAALAGNASPARAAAATRTWIGTSGNFSLNTNWSNTTVPVNGDTANVTDTGATIKL